jgi:Ca2+-binding EF-hand superfamily protein
VTDAAERLREKVRGKHTCVSFSRLGVVGGLVIAVRACEQLHAMPFQEAIQEANLQQRLPDYVRVANKKRAEGERQIRRQIRAAGRRFAEHDLDGSKELDFDEFYCMLPYSLREERSVSELRQCFSDADSNGNGTLSINEFWLWSMSTAGQTHGVKTLEDLLRRYDTDKTGVLNELQFERMCMETGFASGADDMFKQLCGKRAGKLNHSELAEAIIKGAPPMAPASRNLLSQLWKTSDSEDEKRTASTPKPQPDAKIKFHVTGKDAASLRASLQEQLRSSGLNTGLLIKLFDCDADTSFSIDSLEFFTALRSRFGYGGSFFIIDEVFKQLDLDGSGEIGFDELYEFVRGRRHSLDSRSKKVWKMMCKVPPWATYTLESIAWDQETLREQILLMMDRANVKADNVAAAFDKLGDGLVERDEFLKNVGGWFRANEKLWHAEIEEHAEAAYDAMARSAVDGDVILSIEVLQAWLTASGPFDDLAEPPLKKGAVRVRAKKALTRAQREALVLAERELAAQREQERKERNMAIAQAKAARTLLIGALHESAKDIYQEMDAQLAPRGATWKPIRSGTGWAMDDTLEGSRGMAPLRPSGFGKGALRAALQEEHKFLQSSSSSQAAGSLFQQQGGRSSCYRFQTGLQSTILGFQPAWAPAGSNVPRLPSGRPGSATLGAELYTIPVGRIPHRSLGSIGGTPAQMDHEHRSASMRRTASVHRFNLRPSSPRASPAVLTRPVSAANLPRQRASVATIAGPLRPATGHGKSKSRNSPLLEALSRARANAAEVGEGAELAKAVLDALVVAHGLENGTMAQSAEAAEHAEVAAEGELPPAPVPLAEVVEAETPAVAPWPAAATALAAAPAAAPAAASAAEVDEAASEEAPTAPEADAGPAAEAIAAASEAPSAAAEEAPAAAAEAEAIAAASEAPSAAAEEAPAAAAEAEAIAAASEAPSAAAEEAPAAAAEAEAIAAASEALSAAFEAPVDAFEAPAAAAEAEASAAASEALSAAFEALVAAFEAPAAAAEAEASAAASEALSASSEAPAAAAEAEGRAAAEEAKVAEEAAAAEAEAMAAKAAAAAAAAAEAVLAAAAVRDKASATARNRFAAAAKTMSIANLLKAGGRRVADARAAAEEEQAAKVATEAAEAAEAAAVEAARAAAEAAQRHQVLAAEVAEKAAAVAAADEEKTLVEAAEKATEVEVAGRGHTADDLEAAEAVAEEAAAVEAAVVETAAAAAAEAPAAAAEVRSTAAEEAPASAVEAEAPASAAEEPVSTAEEEPAAAFEAPAAAFEAPVAAAEAPSAAAEEAPASAAEAEAPA